MEKSDVRRLISLRKRQHTRQELSVLSLAVVNNLMADSHLKEAHTVLLYYSMEGEVDTHDLVEKLYREGKNVFLPRVRDSYNMDIVAYSGTDSLKPAGSFHILEPQGEPFTDFEKIEVVVVPGIAFTSDGKRMGRGRGYYDRILPLLSNAFKIGICFPFQILKNIPFERYDISMDKVITTLP